MDRGIGRCAVALGRLAGLMAAGALILWSCASRPREIVLASTTSTEDSGLFEYLLPYFHEAHRDYRIRVIAVGSGEALRLAAVGDADVALVHSPEAEEEFVAAGHGTARRRVMFNDFILVGPDSEAGAACAQPNVAAALECIARLRAQFISRGDDSGTHARERLLWEATGLKPEDDWYLEAGQGMGAVLMMASEKGAYTLTDRGTYLSLHDRLELRIIVQGDPALRNQYSVIVSSHAENAAGAQAFAGWITSEAAQQLIGDFGVETYGRPLFVPNAANG
ncbi:MAG: substrate-binding domain-containing protein [Gemmatimonadota bacterium]|nr:MAG: substrate-binding domain-containing protein [Gemmatimonadota bacterium]